MSYSGRHARPRDEALEILLRSEEYNKIQAKKDVIFSMGLNFVWLSLAIIAVIIASDYNKDSSSCGEREYTIDLQAFLYIGGGIQIALGVFHFLWALYSLYTVIHIYSSEDDEMYVCGENFIGYIYYIFLFVACAFLLSWIIIGFVVWDHQMSVDCHHKRIAKMILAWCIIVSVMLACVCCPVHHKSIWYKAAYYHRQRQLDAEHDEWYQRQNKEASQNDIIVLEANPRPPTLPA